MCMDTPGQTSLLIPGCCSDCLPDIPTPLCAKELMLSLPRVSFCSRLKWRLQTARGTWATFLLMLGHPSLPHPACFQFSSPVWTVHASLRCLPGLGCLRRSALDVCRSPLAALSVTPECISWPAAVGVPKPESLPAWLLALTLSRSHHLAWLLGMCLLSSRADAALTRLCRHSLLPVWLAAGLTRLYTMLPPLCSDSFLISLGLPWTVAP